MITIWFVGMIMGGIRGSYYSLNRESSLFQPM